MTCYCSPVSSPCCGLSQLPGQTRPKEVSLRVITATAHGVLHWSRQMGHLPILFEVFGEPPAMLCDQL